MTLTEFLLARIEDDEATALTASGILSGPAQFGFELWVWGDQRLEITKQRVLAECEAKRRIVNGLQPYGELDDMFAPEILGILAAVYSDHPDYRQEWAAE